MYKLLIFDWDGTLIDSAGRIVDCMQKAALDLHYPPLTDEAVRNIIGLGLPEALQMLIPGIDEQGILRMRERYGHYFFAAQVPASELFEGVFDELIRFKEQGYLLAVATGKSRRGLDLAFAETELGHLFDASRCADETRSKPHPQMLFELLDEMKVGVEQALMIGDTEFDLEMASHAGMASCGVSYGAHETERLLKHQPIGIIDRITDLIGHLPELEADSTH